MELNPDQENFDPIEGRKVFTPRELTQEDKRKTFNEKIRWMIG